MGRCEGLEIGLVAECKGNRTERERRMKGVL